jgi:hypothetical protein
LKFSSKWNEVVSSTFTPTESAKSAQLIMSVLALVCYSFCHK